MDNAWPAASSSPCTENDLVLVSLHNVAYSIGFLAVVCCCYEIILFQVSSQLQHPSWVIEIWSATTYSREQKLKTDIGGRPDLTTREKAREPAREPARGRGAAGSLL